MNAKAKENNSAESDKLWTVIKWIDSILCKNLPALSFIKYAYVQIQMGKVEGGERHLLQRGRHPTATAKDEDSVQCLDCSLIEDNQPPEMDTASSASTTKYDFLSCVESWIMYKIFSGSLVQRFGIINKFSVCLWKPQASTTLILEIDVQLKRKSMAAIRQSKRQKSLSIKDIGVKTEIDRILLELRSTKLTWSIFVMI